MLALMRKVNTMHRTYSIRIPRCDDTTMNSCYCAGSTGRPISHRAIQIKLETDIIQEDQFDILKCNIEGSSVCLGAFEDSLISRRIKEEIWIVGGVLSLNETNELRIFGCLLAEDGISQSWGIPCEILL